jgi:hypothetical protein
MTNYGTLKIWTLVDTPTQLSDDAFRTVKRTLHIAHGLTYEEAQEHTQAFKSANRVWIEPRGIFACWQPNRIDLG